MSVVKRKRRCHGTCVPRCQTSTRFLSRHVCAGVIESTASRVWKWHKWYITAITTGEWASKKPKSCLTKWPIDSSMSRSCQGDDSVIGSAATRQTNQGVVGGSCNLQASQTMGTRPSVRAHAGTRELVCWNDTRTVVSQMSWRQMTWVRMVHKNSNVIAMSHTLPPRCLCSSQVYQDKHRTCLHGAW